MDNILVSVICITYNHEEHIAKALDGFLMQKTKFKYEVIIHDDASTDNTAKIIKEYEKKYPDIIKPIYQTVNQYSQGIEFIDKYLHSKAQGKYFALCEGDDYWIDPYKLQKQVEFMEVHDDVSLCVHAAKQINVVSGKSTFLAPEKENIFLDINKIIISGGGTFATCSFMYRKKNASIPDYLLGFFCGDFQRILYSAIIGKVYYMNDVMSVHNASVKGSWSCRIGGDPQKISEHRLKVIEGMKYFDKDTGFQYTDSIKKRILILQFEVCDVYEKDYKRLMSPEFKEIWDTLSVKRKLRIWFSHYMPFVITIKRKLF